MTRSEMYDALIHEALYHLYTDHEMYLMLLENAYQLRMEGLDNDEE